MIPKPLSSIMTKTRYIPSSCHFNKRSFDKKWEVIAQLYDDAADELEINCGGQVVLWVADDRQTALEIVRHLRTKEDPGA